MEGRHLDVTLVSAEDLKKVNLIGKMHTYAVVWVDPYYRQSTRVDKDGGAKPIWNQKLSFPVPEHFFQQPNSRLTVEIYSKGTISDDKLVGTLSIPLSEIVQKENKQEEVVTYQVMKKSGKAKGSLRLSVHVGEKTTIGPPAAAALPPYAAPAPVAAYAQGSKAQEAGSAAPYAYPPAAGGVPPYGYPPQAAPAYPQAYGAAPGYYQQPPPQYYAQPPPPQRRPGFGGGGMGMGLGAGLLAGAVGGLIVGEMVDDAFDGGFDGGCDF